MECVGAPHVEDIERLEEEEKLLKYAERAEPSPEAYEILSGLRQELHEHAWTLLHSDRRDAN